MAEQQQTQQQEQVPSTIDDVYSKFNVEGMAA